MNTVNQNPHISQEKNKTNNPPVWLQYFNKCLAEFKITKDAKYFYDAIKRCSKMVKRVIALLLKMDCLYNSVHPAQEWIRDTIGSESRSYISELVTALAESGFLRIIRRGYVPATYNAEGIEVYPGYFRTNIYKLAPFLHDPEIRAGIAAILPGCKALAYTLWYRCEKGLQSEFPTLLRPNYGNSYYPKGNFVTQNGKEDKTLMCKSPKRDKILQKGTSKPIDIGNRTLNYDGKKYVEEIKDEDLRNFLREVCGAVAMR
jgi:hypothetical protein